MIEECTEACKRDPKHIQINTAIYELNDVITELQKLFDKITSEDMVKPAEANSIQQGREHITLEDFLKESTNTIRDKREQMLSLISGITELLF